MKNLNEIMAGRKIAEEKRETRSLYILLAAAYALVLIASWLG